MAAIYNEIDRNACAWLRQLIAMNKITSGNIAETSIHNMPGPWSAWLEEPQCFAWVHWFAGIGGWDLALQMAGWPKHKQIWTASCPCQPYSIAGKQKGNSDERDLWPDFFRVVKHFRPTTVVGEQVSSAIRAGWMDRLQKDMEAEGYTVGHIVLGAHSVNAPHQRQRLYWFATTKNLVPNADANEHRCPEQFNESREWDSSEPGHCPVIDWSDIRNSRLDDFSGERRERRRRIHRVSKNARINKAGNWQEWERFVSKSDGKSRPIEPGVAPVVDGLPRGVVPSSYRGLEIDANNSAEARTMRIRGYGNAIVPQVAATFVRGLMDMIGVIAE